MKITVNEAKALTLINKKLELNNLEAAKVLATYVTENKLFSSEDSLRFVSTLTGFGVTGQPKDKCFICGRKRGNDNALCPKCLRELDEMINSEKKRKVIDLSWVSEKFENIRNIKLKPIKFHFKKPKFNPLIVVIVCCIVIVGFTIWQFSTLHSHNVSQDTTEAVSQENDGLQTIEALELIDKAQDDIAGMLGPSTTVVQDNIRYYESVGATVLYDEDENTAISIGAEDVDSHGKFTVFGIYIGQSMDEARAFLDEKQVEYSYNSVSKSDSAVITYKSRQYQFFMAYDGDSVSWVRITLID